MGTKPKQAETGTELCGVRAKNHRGDTGRASLGKWGSKKGLVGFVIARRNLGACMVCWKSSEVTEQGTKYDMIPKEDSGCLYTWRFFVSRGGRLGKGH